MAKGLARLLTDEPLRERLAANARRLAQRAWHSVASFLHRFTPAPPVV